MGIEARNVTKRYGDFTALDDVTSDTVRPAARSRSARRDSADTLPP